MNSVCLKKVSFIITLSLLCAQTKQLKAVEFLDTEGRNTPTVQGNTASRAPSRNQDLNGNNFEGSSVLSLEKTCQEKESQAEEAFFRSIEAYEDSKFIEKTRKIITPSKPFWKFF